MGNNLKSKQLQTRRYPLLHIRFSIDGEPFVCRQEAFLSRFPSGDHRVYFVVVEKTTSQFLIKLNDNNALPLRNFYETDCFLFIDKESELGHLSPRTNFKGVISNSCETLVKVKKLSPKWKVYWKGRFCIHPSLDGVFNEECLKIDKKHGKIIDPYNVEFF